jgi:hypothetical protein
MKSFFRTIVLTLAVALPLLAMGALLDTASAQGTETVFTPAPTPVVTPPPAPPLPTPPSGVTDTSGFYMFLMAALGFGAFLLAEWMPWGGFKRMAFLGMLATGIGFAVNYAFGWDAKEISGAVLAVLIAPYVNELVKAAPDPVTDALKKKEG